MEIRPEEFDRAIIGLTKAMDEGFSGIHRRLDKVNGRIDRHDDELQDLQVERAYQKGLLANEDSKPGLTKGEARVIKGILATLLAATPLLIWWLSQKP